jgi:SPP1 gp7 family putative phage head morphogenesis protein
MIAEADWMKAWHDKDVDGNKYIRWGCAIGKGTTANAFDPGQERDEHGRWASGGIGEGYESAGKVKIGGRDLHVEYNPETTTKESADRFKQWLSTVPESERAKSTAQRIEVHQDPETMYERMRELGLDEGIEENDQVRGAFDFKSGTLFASSWNGYEHSPRTLYHELGHSILGRDEDAAESWARNHLPTANAFNPDQVRDALGRFASSADEAIGGGLSQIAEGIKSGSPLMAASGVSKVVGTVFNNVHQEIYELAMSQHSFSGAHLAGRVGGMIAAHIERALVRSLHGLAGNAAADPVADTVSQLIARLRDGAPEGLDLDWDKVEELVQDHFKKNPVSGAKSPTSNAGDFQFMTDPEKLQAFQAWLQTQLLQTVIGKTQEQLWDQYIEEGFKKGAGRAFDDTKKPYAKGYAADQSTADIYAGSKLDFLRSAFGQPVAREKVQLLAARSFDDLENVTADMSQRMSRVLVDGLIQGASPRDIADDLDDEIDIGETRALLIARTEIIRAHAEGQLVAFRQLGVEELGVQAEWSTAGDLAVCPDCEAMEGELYSVDDASGMIPLHPNCRCCWVPASEAFETNRRFGVVNRNYCRDDKGEFAPCGESGTAPEKEMKSALRLAKKKIKDAPVPTKDAVAKAREELETAKRGERRAGGESRGGSAASRRKQRQNLFKEFGGDERGYVVCPWTGLKMHWTNDPVENPQGLPLFERGKIFVKHQGGGYQLPNLIPESFTANRSRNDTTLRRENLT